MVEVGSVGRADDEDVPVTDGLEKESVGNLWGSPDKGVPEKVNNRLGRPVVGGEESQGLGVKG